jgi:hypothetical protein
MEEIMISKELYPLLFAKRWPDPIAFVEDVASKIENPFWGSGGAAREYAKEILIIDNQWQWLAHRVDDFASLVENNMRLKLNKWLFRALLGCGGLASRICSTEEATKWLMDRYISELKNLFDPRYKNHIDLNNTIVTRYYEEMNMEEKDGFEC